MKKYRHPKEFFNNQSFAQKASDKVAKIMGSWKFIIIQTIVVTSWISLNILAWALRWDPYPFILLNLLFSLQAAYATPIIMMSQNRAAELDRAHAENAYHHVDAIDEKQDKQLDILEHQNEQGLKQHQQILEELAQLKNK